MINVHLKLMYVSYDTDDIFFFYYYSHSLWFSSLSLQIYIEL